MKSWPLFALLALFVVPGAFAQPSAEAFDYPALEKLIHDRDIRSIDALLPELPREYRKFYTFIFRTESLQSEGVDEMHPRVVLYGPDAKLILTYTRGVPGHDELEILSFNSAKKEFELRSLGFDGVTPPLAEPVKVNPPRCTKCHLDSPRPIFEPYNLWAGVYGSFSRHGCDSITTGTREHRDYEKFQATGRVGRYSREILPDYPDDLDYRAPIAFADPPKSLRECLQDLAGDEVPFINGIVTNPNDFMTEKMQRLDYLRIHQILRQSARFSETKYAWAALSRGCIAPAEIEKYFPAAALAHGRNYPSTLEHVRTVSDAQYQTRLQDFHQFNPNTGQDLNRMPYNFDHLTPAPGCSPPDVAERLRRAGRPIEEMDSTPLIAASAFLADRMGIGMDGWAMSNRSGTYAFNDGGNGFEAFFSDFPNPQCSKRYTCAELKQKSLAAIAANPAFVDPSGDAGGPDGPTLEPGAGAQILEKRCASCHEASDPQVPTFFPFYTGEASQLTAMMLGPKGRYWIDRIRVRISGEGGERPMPPRGKLLTETERTAVLEYLEDLRGENRPRTRGPKNPRDPQDPCVW